MRYTVWLIWEIPPTQPRLSAAAVPAMTAPPIPQIRGMSSKARTWSVYRTITTVPFAVFLLFPNRLTAFRLPLKE